MPPAGSVSVERFELSAPRFRSERSDHAELHTVLTASLVAQVEAVTLHLIQSGQALWA
jgi:hypothetical protein